MCLAWGCSPRGTNGCWSSSLLRTSTTFIVESEESGAKGSRGRSALTVLASIKCSSIKLWSFPANIFGEALWNCDQGWRRWCTGQAKDEFTLYFFTFHLFSGCFFFHQGSQGQADRSRIIFSGFLILKTALGKVVVCIGRNREELICWGSIYPKSKSCWREKTTRRIWSSWSETESIFRMTSSLSLLTFWIGCLWHTQPLTYSRSISEATNPCFSKNCGWTSIRAQCSPITSLALSFPRKHLWNGILLSRTPLLSTLPVRYQLCKRATPSIDAWSQLSSSCTRCPCRWEPILSTILSSFWSSSLRL